MREELRDPRCGEGFAEAWVEVVRKATAGRLAQALSRGARASPPTIKSSQLATRTAIPPMLAPCPTGVPRNAAEITPSNLIRFVPAKGVHASS